MGMDNRDRTEGIWRKADPSEDISIRNWSRLVFEDRASKIRRVVILIAPLLALVGYLLGVFEDEGDISHLKGVLCASLLVATLIGICYLIYRDYKKRYLAIFEGRYTVSEAQVLDKQVEREYYRRSYYSRQYAYVKVRTREGKEETICVYSRDLSVLYDRVNLESKVLLIQYPNDMSGVYDSEYDLVLPEAFDGKETQDA